MTRSVNRALDLLEALRDAPGPLSLTELAAASRMDKATATRLARDLLDRGYLEYVRESRQYALGSAILDLADRLWARNSVMQNTLRYLEDLRDKTLQTVALWVRAGESIVISIELPSLQPIKFSQGVGTSKPIDSDAPSMVIRAFTRHPVDQDQAISADCRRELEKVCDDGYAYSTTGSSPRAASVAAPVRGSSSVDTAVCLTWILGAEDAEPLARRRYSSQVIGCAQRISRLRQGEGRWQ
jgi:IclR family transcriptional regulator, KDG regulon repressor